MSVLRLNEASCPGRWSRDNSPFAGVTFGPVGVERQTVVARTGGLAVSPEGRALRLVVHGTTLRNKRWSMTKTNRGVEV